MRQVKHDGDSKADFYLPPAMEKVAIIFADHLARSNVVHIQAELAATTLRETLDNEVCDAIAMPATARLYHLLKKSKSAFIVFLDTAFRVVGKNPMPVIVQPVPRTVPPPTMPGPRNTMLAAVPSGSGHYPQQAMHYGRAAVHGPELCKSFARGHCRFGNSCRFMHELGMPPLLQGLPKPQLSRSKHPSGISNTQWLIFSQTLLPVCMMPALGQVLVMKGAGPSLCSPTSPLFLVLLYE